MSRPKKNRRKRSEGLDIHAPSIAILVLAATVFLSYLWLCGKCDAMGSQIKERESELENLNRRVLTEEFKWARMKSPGNMRQYLRQHGLIMDWPDEARILRVPIRVRRGFDQDPDPRVVSMTGSVGGRHQ